MYYVYVLRSNKNSKRYIGYTQKKPEDRLHDHNTGSSLWTRQNGPFDLIHVESFENKKDAIIKEKFLKSGQGRKFLDIILSTAAGREHVPPEADQPQAGAVNIKHL